MYTKEQIDAAIARKLSAQGGATQNPAGGGGGSTGPVATPAGLMEALKVSRASDPQQDEGLSGYDDYQQVAREGLEGMTLGASDALGSAAATAMAFPQTLQRYGFDAKRALTEGVPETYRDIRDTVQYQEDEFEDRNPDMARKARIAGAGASMVAGGAPLARAGAGGLKRATQAALQRGRSRVAGGASNAASGGSRAAGAARTASTSKPRFTANPDGTFTPLNRAAKKVARKSTRKQSIKDGATGGFEVDLAEGIVQDDYTPDKAAAGAAAGLAFPMAMQRMVTNTPLGRLLMSRAAGKALGQKYQPYYYVGSHPATRRAAADIVGSIK